MANELYPSGIYRHYKGDEYTILSVGESIDEATLQPNVVYTRVDGADARKFSRPANIFASMVAVYDASTKTVRMVPRFTFVGFTLNAPGLAQTLIGAIAKSDELLAKLQEGEEPTVQAYALEIIFNERTKIIVNDVALSSLRTDHTATADLGDLGQYAIAVTYVEGPEGAVPRIIASCMRMPLMPSEVQQAPAVPAGRRQYTIEVPDTVMPEQIQAMVNDFQTRQFTESSLAGFVTNNGREMMEAAIAASETSEASRASMANQANQEPDTRPCETEEAAHDEKFAFAEQEAESTAEVQKEVRQ